MHIALVIGIIFYDYGIMFNHQVSFRGKDRHMFQDLKKVHEAAEIIGVSADTIRRWEKKGLVRAVRSPQNHRLFSLGELERIQNKYNGVSSGSFSVLKTKIQTNYSVIELFSGAGGMVFGFKNAGLNSILLAEINKDAVATLRQNLPESNILNEDVANINYTPYNGRVDIVAGGFPCQAFSYAGLSKGFEDTRGTLFFEFARCVNEVQPKIALAENVRGLLRHDQGRTIETMIRTLDEIGYRVCFKLIRAQFHDVPQKRERIFIVGVRKDLKMQVYYPKEKDYLITIGEALKDCPESEGATYPKRKKEIMSHVPPGGYWRDLPEDLQKEYMKKSYFLGGGKTGMARRLSWLEPSLTLTTSPAQKQTERCHPEETRPLNIREYARIQTFPDEWVFEGSIASQYRQIGNAVPVNLAYHIGICLVAMLNGTFDNDTMVLGEWADVVPQKGKQLGIPFIE